MGFWCTDNVPFYYLSHMSCECLHSFIELYHCNMYILMKAHYTSIKLFSHNFCWKFCRLKASGWLLTDTQIKSINGKYITAANLFCTVHFLIYKKNMVIGPTSWYWKRNLSDLSSLESVYHFLIRMHTRKCIPLSSKRKKRKVKSLSRVWLFVMPWTVAYHAPPSYVNVNLLKK